MGTGRQPRGSPGLCNSWRPIDGCTPAAALPLEGKGRGKGTQRGKSTQACSCVAEFPARTGTPPPPRPLH
eukprot:scaffold17146_cov110-Isochrysis_galbana.AAC.1